MSNPDDDLHQLTALTFRNAGDLAELARRITGLEDRIEDLAVALDEVEDVLPDRAPTGAAADRQDADAPAAGADEQADVLDLPRLVTWVRVNVAELLQRRVPQTGGYPHWCRRWWAHPEAIVRFEAARRSWEAASAAGPGDALAVYLAHLDHQLDVLCSDNGPFSGCTGGAHTEHSPARFLAQDEPPPEYLGAAADGRGDG